MKLTKTNGAEKVFGLQRDQLHQQLRCQIKKNQKKSCGKCPREMKLERERERASDEKESRTKFNLI